MTAVTEQIRTIKIDTDGKEHPLTVRQIEMCMIPASNLNVLGNAPEKNNAVFLNPTSGMSLVSIPHKLIKTFDEMKMLNHNLNTFTNFGIKDISVGAQRIG